MSIFNDLSILLNFTSYTTLYYNTFVNNKY